MGRGRGRGRVKNVLHVGMEEKDVKGYSHTFSTLYLHQIGLRIRRIDNRKRCPCDFC